MRGRKAGRRRAGRGPAPVLPPRPEQKNKAVLGIGAEPPAPRRRGAPPFRTPRLPPAEAAPNGARRVTSRGQRAGGCHGDTWASLPRLRSNSDRRSGSAGKLTKPRERTRAAGLPSASLFPRLPRMPRPLPAAPRAPRPRPRPRVRRSARMRRPATPRMLHAPRRTPFPRGSAPRAAGSCGSDRPRWRCALAGDARASLPGLVVRGRRSHTHT